MTDDAVIEDYFERIFYSQILNKPDISPIRKSWFKNSDRISENCIYVANISQKFEENLLQELFSKSEFLHCFFLKNRLFFYI